MRSYVQLECGCLVSCDGGGGLIGAHFVEKDGEIYPTTAVEGCKVREYFNSHNKACSVCGECLICYLHGHCKEG